MCDVYYLFSGVKLNIFVFELIKTALHIYVEYLELRKIY